MTGMADDIIALLDMIEQEATTLREKEPEHELLKFADAVLEKTNWTDDLLSEFTDMFTSEGKGSWIHAWSAYFVALQAANGKRPTEKPTPPKADKPDTTPNFREGFSGYDAGEKPF